MLLKHLVCMTKLPELLIISPFVTANPQRGYEVLLWNHLLSLVKSYRVTLVTLRSLDKRESNCSIHGVDHRSVAVSTIDILMGRVASIRRGLPIQASAFCSKGFDDALSALVLEKTFDGVLCYMSRVVPAVERFFPQSLVSVFSIDPLGISYEKQGHESSLATRALYKAESLLISRLDKRLINSGARFALISRHDAREYERFLGVRNNSIETIPYGVDLPKTCLGQEARIPRSSIISGSGSYGPNARAIKKLLLTQWSDLEAKHQVMLRLVGRGHENTSEVIPTSCEMVKIIGEVDDMFREIQRSMISLCLVSLDVGVQTKVLEALACGTPVICTTGANKGVGGRNREEVLIADTPQELDAAISALIDDTALWHRLSINGRRLVEQSFSWAASARGIHDFVESPVSSYDH